MSVYPPAVFGSTIAHSFEFRDGAGAAVDLTGGSVAVTYTADDAAGTVINKTATLDADPTTVPQASVTLQESDYDAIAAPFRLFGLATATVGATVYVEDEFIQPVTAPQGFGANGSVVTYSEAVAEFGADIARQVIEQTLAEAQSKIERAAGREFVSRDRTETVSGDGSEWVYLRGYPITAVESVSLVAPDGTLSEVSSDSYRADDRIGGIARTGARDTRGGGVAHGGDGHYYGHGHVGRRRGIHRSPSWPEGVRNVSVVYTGGYTAATVPPGLRRAVLDIGRIIIRYRQRDPLMLSQSLTDYSYTRADADQMSRIIDAVIGPYKTIGVA